MSAQPGKHIVLSAVESWGHARPLVGLAVAIVQKRACVATLLVTPGYLSRVNAEISRDLAPDAPQRAMLRVVAVNTNHMMADAGQGGVYDAYMRLAAGEPLQCFSTQAHLPAAPAPSAVLLDWFAFSAMEAIRKVDQQVPILGWQTGSATRVLCLFGPKELGGIGDIGDIIQNNVAQQNKTPGQAMSEYVLNVSDNVIDIAGMPAQYEHELYPYEFPPKMAEGAALVQIGMSKFLKQCNGFIQSLDETVEPEALKAIDGWMGQTGRKVYNVGPLLPSKQDTAVKETKKSAGDEAIYAYLDESLSKYGPQSVIYIAFGSMWGPWDKPEKLWLLLDVFTEKGIPFIFAHSSPQAVVPEEVKQKVQGHGFLTGWAPQQAIFDHPATGWFITHGGQNSVMEALSAGIPMIFWPFFGDQVMNAAHFTDDMGVGFQVFEVRQPPHGLKQSLRSKHAPSGTLEAARTEFEGLAVKLKGEEGEKVKENTKRVQEQLKVSWSDGGLAAMALVRLMNDLAL